MQSIRVYMLVLLSLHSAVLLIYMASQPERLLLQLGDPGDRLPSDSRLRHRQLSLSHRSVKSAAGDSSNGDGDDARRDTRAPDVPKKDGDLARTQLLYGMVFRDDTEMGSLKGEIAARVVWSLVKSFSPEVNDHVREIFQDDYDECKFFATIPALVRRRNEMLLVQRIWLAQYEYRKREIRMQHRDMNEINFGWKNTWQENFLYHMRMNENYGAVEPGELVGIPTTTNVMFSYKSDGAMDPRLVEVGNELLLLFHTWIVDKDSHDEVGGRVHIWNWDKRQKRKLKLPGVQLQRTEINWIPMDVNGSLYVTYSLDPLRVMKCGIDSGNCSFVHEQLTNHKFSFSADHLRGGTPFIAYSYPYYISVGHSVGVTYAPTPDFSVYSTHLIVLHAGNPWRIVYVSRHIEASETWLKSRPIVRNHTITGDFWYPMGIVKWNDDVIDVSCHLNDYDGHVVRLRGIKNLMDKIITTDMANVASGASVRGPHRPRVVQQYVLESLKQRMHGYTFRGDLVLNTPE